MTKEEFNAKLGEFEDKFTKIARGESLREEPTIVLEGEAKVRAERYASIISSMKPGAIPMDIQRKVSEVYGKGLAGQRQFADDLSWCAMELINRAGLYNPLRREGDA